MLVVCESDKKKNDSWISNLQLTVKEDYQQKKQILKITTFYTSVKSNNFAVGN
jgi:hypothetical protein